MVYKPARLRSRYGSRKKSASCVQSDESIRIKHFCYNPINYARPSLPGTKSPMELFDLTKQAVNNLLPKKHQTVIIGLFAGLLLLAVAMDVRQSRQVFVHRVDQLPPTVRTPLDSTPLSEPE